MREKYEDSEGYGATYCLTFLRRAKVIISGTGSSIILTMFKNRSAYTSHARGYISVL